MARRTQTYAIRLAVEGGGQVKAELVSVGQSGEQSLKRIESAETGWGWPFLAITRILGEARNYSVAFRGADGAHDWPQPRPDGSKLCWLSWSSLRRQK
jgi:hypothetical protein